jgi:hypothetical protein
MQNDIQQWAVDFDAAVVSNQTQFWNLFIKKLTRERVVPIISASVSWLTLAMIGSGRPSLPKLASRRRARARRFSLELNNWSTKSATAGQAKMVHQYGDGATTQVNVQTV